MKHNDVLRGVAKPIKKTRLDCTIARCQRPGTIKIDGAYYCAECADRIEKAKAEMPDCDFCFGAGCLACVDGANKDLYE